MQQCTKLDVIAKVSEYLGQDGKPKGRYLRVGTAFLYLKGADGNLEFDGISVELDAVPFTSKLKIVLPLPPK